MSRLEPQLVAVDCDWGAVVTVTSPITHLCPHVDEVDRGTITVTWTTGGDPDTDAGSTVELHSLAGFLASYADRRISHEELALEVHAAVDVLGGLQVGEVTLTFTTAGLDVTVRAE